MESPDANNHRTRPRAREVRLAVLAALLLLGSMLSGCLDVVFPQPEQVEEKPQDGLLRIWAAAAPGAVAGEFAHYNITFGGMYYGRDLFLDDLVLMKPRTTTIDLVQAEKNRQAVEIARETVPDGTYAGFAFYITRASVGVERVVGSVDGRAVTRIEESPIEASSTVIKPRVGYVVFGGRVTDLYLEIDLKRSLFRDEEGTLQHVTIPTGISVYVDDIKVARQAMDGGQSRSEPTDLGDGGKEVDLEIPPSTSLKILDPATEKRHYFDRLQPNKRMSRAMGLHEDLVFDASKSSSAYYTIEEGGPANLEIIEHRWDFGDGTSMTGARVTKNYTEGGIHDVTLTIRDALDNIARDHVTLFVPYTAEQAVRTQSKTASGELLLGSVDATSQLEQDIERHRFTFPEDLEDGALRLGGYRVEVTSRDPVEGDWLGMQSIRLMAESGHFVADETDRAEIMLESAGISVWRGPLKPWVDDEIQVNVQLMAGAMVEYELDVHAHYYHNLSRGLDPHAGHLHGDWPFGPLWQHLDWDGTLVPPEDD